MLEITENTIEILIKNLRSWVMGTSFERVVVGMSGGIDSALAAALAVEALGEDNVVAYFLPYKESNPESEKDARLMASHLGIKMETIDITPMAEAYLAANSFISPLRLGNLLSRIRMTVLFDRSAFHNALVLGTGNKSELLLGYMTWFGDSACSVNPLGDLYKTQVWRMATMMGLPKKLIEKAPSADHSKGQTDEGDLGYSYRDIDQLLSNMIEQGNSPQHLINDGLDQNFVRSICRRLDKNEYKRYVPKILSIGQVAI
ncbi:MAG: NAD+ synthase [Deferribacteraceae bacterium]|jgi:NAD+ synthase|nr:NAD+ synthase [Deferribacteraceae bacterium]